MVGAEGVVPSIDGIRAVTPGKLKTMSAKLCILVYFGVRKRGSRKDAKYTKLEIKFAEVEMFKKSRPRLQTDILGRSLPTYDTQRILNRQRKWHEK